MSSFKKVQEMLLLSVEEDIIDEEEFVLLYEAYRPENLSFPHLAYEKFSALEDKDAAECKADFRFAKTRDIPLLVEALGVPPIFICENGRICDGNEALCIVLKRFAYPCRYSDIHARYPDIPISMPELSISMRSRGFKMESRHFKSGFTERLRRCNSQERSGSRKLFWIH